MMGKIRDRMRQDLALAGYAPGTQDHYLGAAAKFVTSAPSHDAPVILPAALTSGSSPRPADLAFGLAIPGLLHAGRKRAKQHVRTLPADPRS
jgi:hypothetical protein